VSLRRPPSSSPNGCAGLPPSSTAPDPSLPEKERQSR
jgi:hypothetical protein